MSQVKPNDIYSWEDQIKASSTSEIAQDGPEIPKGRVARIDTFIVCDETTVNRILGLGYNKAGTRRWLKLMNAGSSAFQVVLESPLILSEFEKPCFKSTSHAASDVINVICRGIYL